MIEILILFEIHCQVLTMYGIRKAIKDDFSALLIPSLGTIKPALKRLETSGFIKSRRDITKGGRPSVYYSVTKAGLEEMKKLVMDIPLDNPVQFLTASRVKLACADILDKQEQINMLQQLKLKAQTILADINNIIKDKELSYYPKMVFDNLACEYKNFISLLEGFEHACTR